MPRFRAFPVDEHTPSTKGLGAGLARHFGLVALWLLLCLALLPCNAFDSARLLQSAQKMGPAAVQRTQALIREMEQPNADELEKVKSINQFFNRQIQYKDDMDNWGVVDYWASPMESRGGRLRRLCHCQVFFPDCDGSVSCEDENGLCQGTNRWGHSGPHGACLLP
jgi:predicted transglutaminase-like cysteine proteinase